MPDQAAFVQQPPLPSDKVLLWRRVFGYERDGSPEGQEVLEQILAELGFFDTYQKEGPEQIVMFNLAKWILGNLGLDGNSPVQRSAIVEALLKIPPKLAELKHTKEEE